MTSIQVYQISKSIEKVEGDISGLLASRDKVKSDIRELRYEIKKIRARIFGKNAKLEEIEGRIKLRSDVMDEMLLRLDASRVDDEYYRGIDKMGSCIFCGGNGFVLEECDGVPYKAPCECSEEREEEEEEEESYD